MLPYLVFLFFLILVTSIIFGYYYMQQQNDYYEELRKIEYLERKKERLQKKLSQLRSQTIACPTPNLNNPRDCYFGSNYTCSWGELTNRCDLKT